MSSKLATEARIPNARLAAFKPFLGTWTTVGHHSMMPGITLNGRASFEWSDGNTLHGVSSLSKDDKTWEQDLEMNYTRVK